MLSFRFPQIEGDGASAFPQVPLPLPALKTPHECAPRYRIGMSRT